MFFSIYRLFWGRICFPFFSFWIRKPHDIIAIVSHCFSQFPREATKKVFPRIRINTFFYSIHIQSIRNGNNFLTLNAHNLGNWIIFCKACKLNRISNHIHSSSSQMRDKTELGKRLLSLWQAAKDLIIYHSDICFIRATGTYCHTDWNTSLCACLFLFLSQYFSACPQPAHRPVLIQTW